MADTIRRAQLVTPFGIGGLSVLKNGEAVITAGLDSWFQGEDVVQDEFEIDEPRLARTLGVRALYAPPEYRRPWLLLRSTERRNLELTVPFLLLPRWHFCPTCRRMAELPLHHDATGRGYPCDFCRSGNKGPRLKQVRFLAMCEAGHIQDFPWLQWVHRDIATTCTGPLQIRVHSGASLTAIRVSCETCKRVERHLGGIMTANQNGTTELSRTLQKGAVYCCGGLRAWLGESHEPCGLDIRATLRSATNLHFARVKSALFLPPEALTDGGIEALVERIKHMRESDVEFRVQDDVLRQTGPATMEPRVFITKKALAFRDESIWTDDQLRRAIVDVDTAATSDHAESIPTTIDEPEAVFRRQEFDVIRSEAATKELLVRCVDVKNYDEPILGAPLGAFLAGVSLLHRVRETRAFFGFTRVRPDESISIADARRMLSRKPVDWLPASVVRGEGILLELREDVLQAWEQRINRSRHLVRMQDVFTRMQSSGRVHATEFAPRLVLLHTLAHCMINRLVFDAGYSAASLRERLYSSTEEQTRMAGLLIYTAAGDSEGTMGGLVEMGRPGKLEAVLRRTLEAAMWCSLDPVCSEVGHSHGQGPDGCNQAACHSCALVPETSCELFNRFLDRSMLIGTTDQRELGYFTPARS